MALSEHQILLAKQMGTMLQMNEKIFRLEKKLATLEHAVRTEAMILFDKGLPNERLNAALEEIKKIDEGVE